VGSTTAALFLNGKGRLAAVVGGVLVSCSTNPSVKLDQGIFIEFYDAVRFELTDEVTF